MPSIHSLHRNRKMGVGEYSSQIATPLTIAGSSAFGFVATDQPNGSGSVLTASTGMYITASSTPFVRTPTGLFLNGSSRFYNPDAIPQFAIPLLHPGYSVFFIFGLATLGTGYQSLMTFGTTAGYYIHNNKFDYYSGGDNELGPSLLSGSMHDILAVSGRQGPNFGLEIYIDGVKIETTVSSSALTYTCIGGNAAENINGYYNECWIWPGKALTSGDAISLHKYRLNTYPSTF